MIHNTSRNKVSTGILCPEGSGEEGKRLMQNPGSTVELALSIESALKDQIVLKVVSVGRCVFISTKLHSAFRSEISAEGFL